MRPFLHHVQQAYERCLKLEKTLAIIDNEDGEEQYFPLIVGRRPSRKHSNDTDHPTSKPKL